MPALEDGNYSVQASANGYVSQPFNQTFPIVASAQVTVSGGQPKKDVNISMVPAGNVSGRIRDTSDQPLVNVQVQLLRSSFTFNFSHSFFSNSPSFFPGFTIPSKVSYKKIFLSVIPAFINV